MYCEQMGPRTILFKSDDYCRAYNLEYLNKNFTKISKYLSNIKEIYYKCNSSRSSWINYKEALLNPLNKNLNYSERIIIGKTNNKLSDMLTEIPETIYVDKGGYKYNIGARDGLDSISDLRPLATKLSMNISKRLIKAEDTVDGKNKIVVNFHSDIRNAIITFNGLFEKYKINEESHNTVTFVEDLTLDADGNENFRFPRDNEGNIRTDWCNIIPYIWKDIKIEKTFKAIKKDDEGWFYFNEEVDSSCLLFYNKVMYFFDVNPNNGKMVKILNVDIGNLNNYVAEDVTVVKMKDTVSNAKLKQQRLVGFYDMTSSTVYFPSVINNAIITYNGVVEQYIICPDKKSIVFKIPADLNFMFDISVNTYSKIYAVNFYTGTLDGHSYYSMPNEELSHVANTILEQYHDKTVLAEARLRALEKMIEDENDKEIIFNDYQEILTEVDDSINFPNNQVFILKYVPVDGTIRLFVNGIKYDKDVYFTYYKPTNKIIWTFGKDQNFNGFNITSDMQVSVMYDIYYKDNPSITDPAEFKRANQ